MAIKNVKVIEQHIEKIVLAVAVAGAAFMGYLATQKVELEGGVGPNDVEQQISSELARVKGIQEKLPAPANTSLNYVSEYQRQAGGQPLDNAIVTGPVPSFGPKNLPPSRVEFTPDTQVQTVTPDPVEPEMLHADALQLQVASDPPQLDAQGQPVPIPAGMQLVTHSKNVVVIDGWVPTGKMLLQMANIKEAKERLSPDLQRALVYKIAVTRSELNSNGTWSEFKEVPPTQGSAAPIQIPWGAVSGTDISARMADVDAGFKQIMLPDFYRDALGQPVQPPIITRPEPASVITDTAKLDTDINTARTQNMGGGFRPTTPATPTPVAGTQGAATMPAVMLPAMDQIKNLTMQPFTFWDDTVKSDHTYRYKVQVQFVNPTLGWKWGLKNPAMKNAPVLALAPVLVPGAPVVVHSDIAFFIQGTNTFGGAGISGSIYKQEEGRWFVGQFSADKGGKISTSIKTPGQVLDIDTNYTIVDYQADGRGVRVILSDPTGNLVTRDAEEFNKPERLELDSKVKAGFAAATATAPADATGTSTLPPMGGGVTPLVTPTSTPPATRRGPVLGPPVHGGTPATRGTTTAPK
ncbi:MAG TPA: hypothetical protein VGN88_07065 [Phycisphaerae bacterium]|jgi:hypothetical protein